VNERVAPDREWAGHSAPGDLAAWRALHDQHLPLVVRIARRMGVAESDLADLCQEVFLRVYRGLGGFRGEAQFSTWMYRITVNEAARLGRAHSLRRALATLLGREVTPAPARAPDDELARAEAARVLNEILGRMKPKHRAVFMLFELEELSLEEIAAVVDCPLETVRSRLRHARAEFDRHRRQRAAVGGAR